MTASGLLILEYADMPNHLESYIDIISKVSPDIALSIRKTVKKIVPEHIESFSHKEHIKGLLLGQVQSGKTGQMFGIIAAAADTDDAFSIFILLTSDISALQKQTCNRALDSMDTFNICDEHDEMRFMRAGARKPSLIVLKKNSAILKKWRNILASSGFCKGRPIFVVDDEADAASLNTLVNKEEQSAINSHLQGILNLSTSSFYLQVTATPQSLLLQTEESNWRPSFVYYFPPGKNYLGGDFFYTKPKPFTNKITADDELSDLLHGDGIAEGLKRAIETYLVTCAHISISGNSSVCNFLVHPSIRILDHEKIKAKVVSYLNLVFANIDSNEVSGRIKNAWDDLKVSKPDIKSLGEIVRFLKTKPEISVYTMNSGPEGNSRMSFDEGFCIIIGGNSLGRGVTFKSLQTVYYCRASKAPQADTFWQHCRMFGYDRDPLLMRVFMPEALFNLFYE
ncbi:MAG: Z1 domain-containing protein, partial [bacterium]|nr:Z1 domain-containing protein [bacterium]